MEGRMRREPLPRAQQGRKVPVVYYLCRNRQLEQPHFIEVPLSSSSGGLYLRDVIDRLNAVRGKRMAAMYSWSCKRGYKNGFVWHDLGEDDLILPAHGDEYVLKGSELLDQSSSERYHDGMGNPQLQDLKRPQQASSVTSLSSMARDSPKSNSPASPPPPLPPLRETEISPSTNRSSTSENFSPEPVCRNAPKLALGFGSHLEDGVSKPVRVQDASTQTEDSGRKKRGSGAGAHIVDIALDMGSIERQNEEILWSEGPEIVGAEKPPPVTSSTAAFSSSSSSCGKTDTLKTLIRDELSQKNDLRIFDGEESFIPTKGKLKATDMLVQLITCGAISVKDDYNLEIVSNNRPRYVGMNPSPPRISSSTRLGENDCLSESQRVMGLRLEDDENYIGNITETQKYKGELEEGSWTLQSSSFGEGNNKISDLAKDYKTVAESARSKCLPRAIKIGSCKQSRIDTINSPALSTRIFSAGSDSTKSSPLSSSKGGSKRVTDDSSSKGSSSRLESFREETKKDIKIQERMLQELGL
ncbi:hypothetical protein Cni_G03591 [Canna indica]|uniref:SOSEKI DIX-like domain-containing protein n=1 Tax=Canna indica TaxID=4628 RepID=A0AAQ3JU66_9LILI|nr:hypothetical protein Cni_G03591 [Canna indica]